MKQILMIATGGTIASKEGGDGLTPAMTGEELVEILENGLRLSRVGQVLVERCMPDGKKLNTR